MNGKHSVKMAYIWDWSAGLGIPESLTGFVGTNSSHPGGVFDYLVSQTSCSSKNNWLGDQLHGWSVFSSSSCIVIMPFAGFFLLVFSSWVDSGVELTIALELGSSLGFRWVWGEPWSSCHCCVVTVPPLRRMVSISNENSGLLMHLVTTVAFC